VRGKTIITFISALDGKQLLFFPDVLVGFLPEVVMAAPAGPLRNLRSPSSKQDPDRDTIIRLIDEVYRGPAWHGPSVRACLRGVDHVAATWRLGPKRNTIWELVLHLAYARKWFLGRLVTKPVGKFPRKLRASWWPEMPSDQSASAWTADLELLDTFHGRLLQAIANAPASSLQRVRSGKKFTIAHELLSLAPHDTYHAGQIRLLALTAADSR